MWRTPRSPLRQAKPESGKSRGDPRQPPTSLTLSLRTLESREPSMSRRLHDQHAPPAANGVTDTARCDAAIRVRTIFVTAPQQEYRIGGRGRPKPTRERERTSATPARARSGACSSDAGTRSCGRAGNLSARHAFRRRLWATGGCVTRKGPVNVRGEMGLRDVPRREGRIGWPIP